ncbi:unnamed protein product, partial [Polarella glacialis]
EKEKKKANAERLAEHKARVESGSGSGSDSESSSSESSSEKKKKTKKDKKKPKKKEKKKKDKKKGKKDKKKDKKKGKKEEGKEKKKGKGAKKKNRSGVAVSNQYGKYGIIKPEDFFNKKPEFLSWAMDVKKSNTDAMGQMQQRDLFKEYIEDYNTATMPCKKYYNMGVWEQETAAKRKKKLMATDLDEKERNSLVSFDDENARKMEMAANKAKKHENLIKQEVGNLRMNKEKAEEMMHQTRLRGQVDMLRQTGHEGKALELQARMDPNRMTMAEKRQKKSEGGGGMGFAPS